MHSNFGACVANPKKTHKVPIKAQRNNLTQYTKIMCRLPTDLENIVGYFAYGGEKYDLTNEVDYLLACRGCIPEAFLANTVYIGPNGTINLDYFYVNNPLKKSNPFFPWYLVHQSARVFSNVFSYWAAQITSEAFANLHTYRRTFIKNCIGYCNSRRNCFHLWNNLVSRYLSNPVLLDIKSYDVEKFDGLFNLICFQLETASFILPRT